MFTWVKICWLDTVQFDFVFEFGTIIMYQIYNLDVLNYNIMMQKE